MLLRDLRKGDDPQLTAIAAIIAQVAPDVLLLTDFDYDLDGLTLAEFVRRLKLAGTNFPYSFSARPNSGMQTGLDLDGDGYFGDASDGQGFGRFNGEGGMAIISKYPIETENIRDLSKNLWRDELGATLPQVDGAPFPSPEAIAIQRLSTTGHWILPITIKNGPLLTLMAWSATPPVFDGEEDQNGLRNRDELLIWENIIRTESPHHFVVLGNANLDPVDGQGITSAMANFLQSPAIQDPKPQSDGAKVAADSSHNGDPATDTANWDGEIPGNLRVSYVLPSIDWTVTNAGVFWPAPSDPLAVLSGEDGAITGPHHLVWVDLTWLTRTDRCCLIRRRKVRD